MNQRPATPVVRIGIALGLLALATAVRAAVDPLLGEQAPFAFHYIAVIVTAWFAGFDAAVVSAVASAAVVDYLFTAPRYSLALAPSDFAGTVVFAAIGIGLAWQISRWRVAERAVADARDALGERASRLELQAKLLENAYDAIFVRNAEERITFWNRGAEELYGWSAAEALGRNPHNLLHTNAETQQALTDSLARTGAWNGQITHRRKDGREVISDSRQKIVDAGAVLEINRDVTEARRVQLALLENERRLSALMNAATESIWLLDHETVLALNTTAARRFGQTVDEIRGKPWRPQLPPEIAALRGEQLERVYATGEPVRFEDERAGMRFDHTFYPVFGDDGAVSAVAIFSRDVTEQKRAEDELRETSLRLAYHVSHSPLAVIEFGPDMRVTRWSGAAEQMFGWTAAEVMGKRMEEIRWVYDEDARAVHEVSEHLRTGVDPQLFSSNRNYRKDGTVLHCEWYNSSLIDDHGRLLSILSLVLDVTERKRLEAELRTQADQLAHANRLKDEFLATLSHELRTPLNAILGWSQILSKDAGLERDRVRRGVDVIARNARLQTRLVEDLLDVSRIMTGSVHLDLQQLDVRSVAEQALDATRTAAEAKQITIATEIEPGLMLTADPVRIQQVIWNLLSNAVKFTPAAGAVTLAAHGTDGHIVLTVRDTGIGIREDFLPYVFDRFTQADSSPTRAHGGLGLGLAIVRHIVELHGGTITVSSAGEDRGTVFTVTLPVRVSGRSRAHHASLPAIAAAALSGVRVLAVDDDPDSLEVMDAILEAAGAVVAGFLSAREAEDCLPAFSPDVLVSDIAMAGDDGYALIRRVRSSGAPYAGIPAVAVTAYGGDGNRDAALAAGYDRHLAKPIAADDLVAVVASLVRRSVI